VHLTVLFRYCVMRDIIVLKFVRRECLMGVWNGVRLLQKPCASVM
jgi:hypothetical protein